MMMINLSPPFFFQFRKSPHYLKFASKYTNQVILQQLPERREFVTKVSLVIYSRVIRFENVNPMLNFIFFLLGLE